MEEREFRSGGRGTLKCVRDVVGGDNDDGVEKKEKEERKRWVRKVCFIRDGGAMRAVEKRRGESELNGRIGARTEFPPCIQDYRNRIYISDPRVLCMITPSRAPAP